MKQYRFYWNGLLLALGLAFLGIGVLSAGLQVYAAQNTNSFLAIIAENSQLNLRSIAAANRANLAPNPDFEEADQQNPESPDHWSAQGLLKTTPSYIKSGAPSGCCYIRLTGTKFNGHGTWSSDKIASTPGQIYAFSGWVRVESNAGGSGESMLRISFRDNSDAEVGAAESTKLTAVGDWTQITATGLAPANAFGIYLEAKTQGEIATSFDNVALVGAGGVEAPILRIKGNDDPDPVDAGAELTYTLVISNEGNAAEEGFTVTLALDENIILDAATPGTTTMDGPQLVWGNPNTGLDVGGVYSITVNTHLLEGLPNGLRLSSFATVTGKIANTNVIDEVVTFINSAPAIELSKSAPATITPGSDLVYTIRVTNTGNAPAQSIVFGEDYPDNGTCFDSTGLPAIWSVENLAPGASASTDLSGAVGLSCPGGSVINNRVSILVQPGGQSSTALAQTSVAGTFTPCLGMALHAPAPDQLWPDEPHTYLFELENTCTLPATDIVLTATDSLGWPAGHFSVTPTFVENLAVGGIQSISVTGIATPCTPSEMRNILTLTASDGVTLSASADLTLTVGARPGGDLQPGGQYVLPATGQFTLTHVVTNTGNATTTFLLYNDERMLPGWNRQWIPTATLTIPPCQSRSRDSLLTYPKDYLTTTIPTKLADTAGDNELFDLAFDTMSTEKFWQMSLAPWAANTPCRLSPDRLATCRFQLTNTGNQPLDNFLIAMTDTLKWGNAYLNVSANTAAVLWPDASRTVTVTAQVPADVPGNTTNTLSLKVTSAAITTAATLDMVVDAYYQAALESETGLNPVIAAQPFDIPYILTNTGNVAAAFALTASDSLGWELTATPTTTALLNPGEGQSVAVSGVMAGCVPSNTLNPLILNATPIGENAPVATETLPIIVGRWVGAQLTPGSEYVAPPNQTVTLTHQLTNTGSVTTAFTLNTATPEGWTVNWLPNATVNLAPCGGTSVVQTKVNHPEVDGASEALTTTVTLTGVPGDVVAQVVDHVLLRWYMVYLPLCLKEPPLPAVPTIETINNPDINGDYAIRWNEPAHASHYILEESENAAFSPATEITNTTQPVVNIVNAAAGAHYYRVRACNILDKCSAWSAAAFIEAWYEQEPNSVTSSNGPLSSGETYYGRPDRYETDPNDYYLFRTTSAGQITMELTGYTGKGGWLLMYYEQVDARSEASMLIKSDGTATLIYNGDPGTYYVRIYTESGFNDTPYALTVTFPETQQSANRPTPQ